LIPNIGRDHEPQTIKKKKKEPTQRRRRSHTK